MTLILLSFLLALGVLAQIVFWWATRCDGDIYLTSPDRTDNQTGRKK